MSADVTLDWAAAIIYGLIQGLTEFLPVSSSGHLRLAHLLGLGGLPGELQLPFDVLLHAASLIAIVIGFRAEIQAALAAGPRLWALLLLGIVPAGLAGLLGRDLVVLAGTSWWALALGWFGTAGFLLLGQWRARSLPEAEQVACLESLRWRQSLLVGLGQILALLPGVSRSGSTVATGLMAGINRPVAVGFSFLIGLPLIAAATAKDALSGGFCALWQTIGPVPLAVAFVVSLLSSLLAIVLLRLVVSRDLLHWFAAYCGLLALTCLVIALLG